ncbi:unnamed protein product [Polarella glacialis]|uniref:Uncharacterized protein n=1 Tax=Polarella glacialis TaxID=89957 RepID=A0A813J1F0_POLGL|nr:unnamed protein product [Polarella glacialis]
MAYSCCSDTVATNPLGMVCRTYHLGVAAMAGNAATHCLHAAKTPRALALPKFLRASTAVSTPPRAAELQATWLTRVAATQLPQTHWAWCAAPTTLASQPWQATLPRTAPMPPKTPRVLSLQKFFCSASLPALPAAL